MVPPLKKRVIMNKPFLTINENSALELSDLSNESNTKIIFDINSDFDGSIASFATFAHVNGLSNFITSSSIDFPDEYGIDSTMLDSFFDAVKTYEVN